MVRSLIVLAGLVAASTIACASPSHDDGNSASADVVTTRTSLEAAIASCDSKNKTESDNAESTMAMVESQVDFRTCVSSAMDAAVPVIEGILKTNDSASAGGVKAALTKARADNDALCEELHKSSPNFGGTLQRVEDAGCGADRERFLADIVLSMVQFSDGAAPVDIAEARADHAACYQTFDATDAESTMDMIKVSVDLGTCVMTDAAPFIATLAQTEVDNDATQGPLATAQSRLQAAVDAKLQSSSVLCDQISEAGENGIGTLSRVMSAACQARVAESTYTLLKPVGQ